ncbi:non-homologous end-joining factor 1 [Chanos chanos]|uniref:Non-homologous end-joining factor 1 n=1 Tax=Chanos chanos TaxID=29144 RepID=A0A6J2W4Y7_CHACN|nr:non-homologous end-joining factor 1 [Chanos chanos]
MEGVGRTDAAVLELPWVPVCVRGCKLLAKAWFGDTEYRVLLSDLNCVWEEEMDAEAIQTRAQKLNKRLSAPVTSIYSHLRSVAQPRLSGQTEDQEGSGHFSLEYRGTDLTLRLKSLLAGVPFHWEFCCTSAPVTVVCRQLVRPLLAISQVLRRQVGELGALLIRKDAEIQDYRENGAALTRSRLQTELFEEDRYRENFITETLPQMGLSQESVQFDSDLQELYVAVSSQRNGQKRKRADDLADRPDDSSVPVQNAPDTDPAGSMTSGDRSSVGVEREQSENKEATGEPQEAESEQTVPLTPAVATAVSRAGPRPKKKKALGLFR